MIASLVGFLMGFIGSMPVAGPISLLVFHRGVLARYRDGWAIALGGAFAEGVYCALAVHGFSILLERFTFFVPLVKGVGILLLLALALYLFLAAQGIPRDRAVTEPLSENWGGQFCIGLGVAALNPSLLLTWSGILAALYSLADLRFDSYDKIAFAAGAVLGIVTWFSILLTVFSRFRDRFPFRFIQKLIRNVRARSVGITITCTKYGSIQASP